MGMMIFSRHGFPGVFRLPMNIYTKYTPKKFLSTYHLNREIAKNLHNLNTQQLNFSPKVNKEKHTELKFNKEQQYVIDLVVNKQESIFLTGAAGTGKTVLLRELIERLKQKHGVKNNSNKYEYNVLVTATTGLAAYHIGGQTYHSALGLMELNKNNTGRQKIQLKAAKSNAWKQCKVLIIDEVSMMEASTLDFIDKTAKEMRKNYSPFGGIQVILCGDFFQLPPVDNKILEGIIKKYDELEGAIDPTLVNENKELPICEYAFKSKVWSHGIKHCLSLSTVFRQLDDPEFVKCLNELRLGIVSPTTEALMKRVESKSYVASSDVITLFGTRRETSEHNSRILKTMKGPMVVFEACHGGNIKDTEDYEIINKASMLADSIPLKIGSKVMITKNVDHTLYNGTTGTIVGFTKGVTFHTKNEILGKMGSQAGVNAELIDMETIEYDASGKHVVQFDLSDVTDNFVKKFENFNDNTEQKEHLYPVFEYYNSKLCELRRRVIMPVTVSTSTSIGNTVIHWKTQLPLISAWGLTIHKSQGQTYDSLKCDFSRFFTVGQAYVALSRVKSTKNLVVENWNPEKVVCDEQVIEFHKKHVKDLDLLVGTKSSITANECNLQKEKEQLLDKI